MKKFKLIGLIVFLLILSFLGNSGKASETDKKIKESKAIINKLMEEKHIVGLSITILKNGEKLWSEGFGYADLENQVKVDPGKTMFRVGSVSKSFTSATLACLYEKGKVDLNADVRRYVPEFPQKKYPVTVKQVAGHTGGIRHYSNAPDDYFNSKRYTSISDALIFFRNDSLLFKPGESYKYSSFGYTLLAAVIEGASSQKYLDCVRKEIFDRVGMRHTTADFVDSILIGRSGCYEFDSISNKIINTRYVDNSYKWPGGGFLSTSEDIAKFAWAFQSGKIVNDTTRLEFITSQTLKNGEPTKYGMGWTAIGKNKSGVMNYGHGGTAVGGQASMHIYPDQNIVIAIAYNTWKAKDARKAFDKIEDIFTKE